MSRALSVVSVQQPVPDDDFEKTFIKYERFVYHTCFFILKNKEDAEDAKQQTFEEVWKHQSEFKFRNGAKFSTWLYRIAINCSLMVIRKRWRRENDIGLPDFEDGSTLESLAFATTIPDPFVECCRSEARGLTMRCLAGLSPKLRVAVHVRYIHELTTVEAAKKLSVSREVIKARNFKARKKLREKMAELGLCVQDLLL